MRRGSSAPATVTLRPGDAAYPAEQLKAIGDDNSVVAARGDVDLLTRHQFVALFCSVRCPGDLILKTYDLARALRDAGVPVVGGFHSPMEKECLRLLLRGRQPVVVCPARGIENMRVPSEWRPPLAEGRLLLLSPFSSSHRRPTADLAALRNDFVATLAHRVFIAHAAPGGRTEAFACKVLGWGKPLLTLESDRNANLVALGALPVTHEGFQETLRPWM
ncbi:MAG: DNA-processing protein DprA [Chloroflexi bacterium]|nr:DNA-processing protein DprA [Chloroflexota bacterium]